MHDVQISLFGLRTSQHPKTKPFVRVAQLGLVLRPFMLAVLASVRGVVSRAANIMIGDPEGDPKVHLNAMIAL